jgi:hypothetical protein
MVNGQTSNVPWIRFANLAQGGTLAFTMGTSPNTHWGSDLSLAPPSYVDGMTSPLAGNCLWGTGLETNDLPITWTNTVDATLPGGGMANVGPILDSVTGPELGVRNENSQSGNYGIMYSGKARGEASDYAYMKVFDLDRHPIAIAPGMHLSYWIFPQGSNHNALVTGSNSVHVALDVIFTDGTNLRDSGLTDQAGVRMHPADQGRRLALDTWNYVTVDLTPLAGKTVSRIDVGYDHPGSSGGYRGFVDDIAFTTPAIGFTNAPASNRGPSADGPSHQPRQ